MSRIFISYKRSDAREIAEDLTSHLKSHIPSSAIFLDLEDIAPGEDFSNKIFHTIAKCEIALLIITPDWISRVSKANTKGDWIKMEVETALRLSKVIIPILTDDNHSFYDLQLPSSIKKLRDVQTFNFSNPSEDEYNTLVTLLKQKLAEGKLQKEKNIAQKIAKSHKAIQHVWLSLNLAHELHERPEPSDIWNATIQHAKESYGEKAWRRILTKYGIIQSEDLGLIIFACILDGLFLSSADDDPSDYWGLGSIHDTQ